MTEPEHLARAPIVEAALAIGATFANPVDQETLASFQGRLGGRYPNKEVRISWTGQVKVTPDAAPQFALAPGSGPAGYLFKTADAKQGVQALKDGFSFSRFRPYQDWDTFSKEARDLWERFAVLTKPEKVHRIGLRYINRLELPLPFGDFKEYLLTVPEIAPELPQALASFFFRVVMPLDDLKAFGTITETTVEAEATKAVVPVILDVDVFRTGTFPTAADKLWPSFDQLRVAKNRLFFKSLTDKAKDLFR